MKDLRTLFVCFKRFRSTPIPSHRLDCSCKPSSSTTAIWGLLYIFSECETWREALVSVAGFPEYLATHLAAVAQDHQDGIFSAETNVVKTIGGQEPQSVEDFVRQNRAHFGVEVALS